MPAAPPTPPPELDPPGAPATATPIPWRTIWATILAVGLTYLGYQTVLALGRVLTWLAVAVFFAVILTPPVDFLQHRLRIRRSISILLVLLAVLAVVGAMLYAFIRPLADAVGDFADELPTYVEDAREGRGWIGELIDRYELEETVEENQDRIREGLTSLGESSLDILRQIFSTIVALLTIFVLTFLLIMQGPALSTSILGLIPGDARREQVRRIAVDSARAMSGYVFGNLLISVIAGVAAWLWLTVLGVPFAPVLGLFVGFADLIPLVGATLGAIPPVLVAFIHSVPAGIATLIFFIIYQQFENHVLQVTIMARTVRLNPLAVLLAVIVGIELYGFLGALLAIPVAGTIQVIVRDVWDERQGRLKLVPTVGADELPIGGDEPDDAAAGTGAQTEA